MEDKIDGYVWSDAAPTCSHSYLFPYLKRFMATQSILSGKRLCDLGCGNGATAALCSQMGLEVVGIDPSNQGIAQARQAYPNIRFEIGSAYDDLSRDLGTFDYVLSFEVVEHVFYPRKYASTVYDLLKPGGTAIISTPYHGYWKNLALAITGKWDDHLTALWDYGHIKFWSINTLTTLLEEAGFKSIEFHRVGRIPSLAMSMIATAKK